MKKELLLLLPIILGIFNNETLRQINFKNDKEFDDVVFVNLDGEKKISLKEKIGKNTIMIVNTASYCGFTKQYDGLEELHQEYKDKGLLIIGVPSNDFKQEKETDEEIKDFCEVNFNTTFFISKKKVIKGKDSMLFYKILKEKYEIVPKWNFHKILITKNRVIHDFSSFTKPDSKKITNIIDNDIN